MTLDKAESEMSTLKEDGIFTPSIWKVERVDYYYSLWSKSWKYRVKPFSLHRVSTSCQNTSSNVAVELFPRLHPGDNDPWKDSGFVSMVFRW